jgi:orotate phosphoribosyltransferase
MDVAQKIAKILLDNEAVTLRTNPPYTWISGIKAPIYCDNRILISYPDAYRQIVNEFKKIIQTNNYEFDVLGGTATAGIPWAAFLAYELNKPMAYVRHKLKTHGANKQIEGRIFPRQKVLIIEDLISTGGSALRSAEICKNEAKAEVVATLAIFTYEFEEAKNDFAKANLQLHTLSNFSTLIDVATQENYLEPEKKQLVLEWSKDPQGWSEKLDK